MESITKQAAGQGITYAAIVALNGAVDSFTVSTNPAGDATAHTYSAYSMPAEMTATGEIVDGRPHIHAVMAVQGDRAIVGHLHKAQLDTSFARAYVIPSEQHVAIPPNSTSPCPPTSRSCSSRFRMSLRAGGGSTTPESRRRPRQLPARRSDRTRRSEHCPQGR